MQLENDSLEVEENVDDIFLNTIKGGVLVEYPVDADFPRRINRQRGQQDATQRIAQGVTVAAFERLHHNLGLHGRNALHVDDAGFQKSTALHGPSS